MSLRHRKLSELVNSRVEYPIPDILHFVWIGDPKEADTTYMNIWKSTNIDKDIYFWIDDNTSLATKFHDFISDYLKKTIIENKVNFEVELKNQAFGYVTKELQRGVKFNEAIKNFLLKKNIVDNEIALQLDKYQVSCGIQIREIETLFSNESSEFLRFYYYEILLRGNFAGASDIVRLLILYNYGGVYIDLDTLPSLNGIFLNYNKVVEEKNWIEDDFILYFKTKKVLSKLLRKRCCNQELVSHYKSNGNLSQSLYKELLNAIEQDLLEFNLNKILPLGRLYVHKNLMSVGAVKRLKGIYFNNFMFTHKHSKIIRIIMRVMKKRYHYLEKNDCIFNIYEKKECNNYLSRILTWRTELMFKNYGVTSALTGPGLIIEVMLGIAYSIMDLNKFNHPSEFACFIHDESYGIASFAHNLDTPEGKVSSWRK